jgi:hypothetical protein
MYINTHTQEELDALPTNQQLFFIDMLGLKQMLDADAKSNHAPVVHSTDMPSCAVVLGNVQAVVWNTTVQVIRKSDKTPAVILHNATLSTVASAMQYRETNKQSWRTAFADKA